MNFTAVIADTLHGISVKHMSRELSKGKRYQNGSIKLPKNASVHKFLASSLHELPKDIVQQYLADAEVMLGLFTQFIDEAIGRANQQPSVA